MKRWYLLFIFMIWLIGTAGCNHLKDYVDITREKGMSREYLDVLNEWTRSQVIYSQFETQVHISATYQSPEFNRAYLKEYARIYYLREEERKKRENIQKELTSDFIEFIFYAAIPEKTSNDFDKRGSIWTVFLINREGERIDPQEVRRIEPITPVITNFFPYIKPYYGMVYRLRFQPVSKTGADPRTLVFTSVLGKVELKFENR